MIKFLFSAEIARSTHECTNRLIERSRLTNCKNWYMTPYVNVNITIFGCLLKKSIYVQKILRLNSWSWMSYFSFTQFPTIFCENCILHKCKLNKHSEGSVMWYCVQCASIITFIAVILLSTIWESICWGQQLTNLIIQSLGMYTLNKKMEVCHVILLHIIKCFSQKF